MKHTVNFVLALAVVACLYLSSCKKEESIKPQFPKETFVNGDVIQAKSGDTITIEMNIDSPSGIGYIGRKINDEQEKELSIEQGKTHNPGAGSPNLCPCDAL